MNYNDSCSLRDDIYSFQSILDETELSETRLERDFARRNFAVVDVTNLKLTNALAGKNKSSTKILPQILNTNSVLNLTSSVYSVSAANSALESMSENKMLSLAFEYLKSAKECRGDPGPDFQHAAELFTKLKM
jgi:hypothetical protein